MLQKNIFTSLPGTSLSPGGVVRKGRPALLTAWQLAWEGWNQINLSPETLLSGSMRTSEFKVVRLA